MLFSALEIIPVRVDFSGVFVLLFSSLLLAVTCRTRYASSIPLVNGKRRWEITSFKARMRFVADASNIIKAGFAKSPKAFYAVTDMGTDLVLSPDYIGEVRNDRRLDAHEYSAEKFHRQIPGFEAFATEWLPPKKSLESFLYGKLTPAIGKCTGILSSHADTLLQRLWTDNKDWHEIPLKDTILELNTCMGSRIFLGEDLCQNPAWTELVKRNAVNAFIAADKLNSWPKALRPFVHWFLPSCRVLRGDVREARQFITPAVQQRRDKQAARQAQGKAPDEYFDTIQWMEEVADGQDYDPALVQLALSMGSTHTMTDLMTQVMLNLTKYPDLVEQLRREIIAVKTEEEWGRPALRKLMLMDSVVKETQRLKPISRATMRRKAGATVRLSDGLEIPKNTTFILSTEHMLSNAVYPHADQFDGYRFYKLRQEPRQENAHQLVATSNEHVGFGHGCYACPGRFFADSVMKVMLCHILLKYDFRLADGSSADSLDYGTALVSNPMAKLVIRRREEEIAL
ncbi:cytochrome P450 [Aspergillus melleus]|uniref:cytochrome P450 n=1 Tax=Aspergillus melleus TaxID=138277 RepID=UPI001E8DDEAA|nr:uncharacterized protein LDX57_008294 [Aspergillus melleus]KAH8430631.1 hypothetical protein LDX57_008294 [Aspergillus melleus]